jgi:predicted dehydrogenase
MNLKPEERKVGRENYESAVATTRRDFLKAAAVAPVAGAFYFGYERLEGEPVRAAIIGTGNEGNVLIRESNPDYLRYVAFSDVRPSNQQKTRKTFSEKYGSEADQIELAEDYHDLLKRDDIEMIVIALPLHLHAPVTIEALNAGKHVFCEKLMARTVKQCKDMGRAANGSGKLLAIGHQRHYSALYDNTLHLVRQGLLGDIKYIRALWHRNQTWPGRDGWKPDVPDSDRDVDFKKHGYNSLEELVQWRLHRRTSGGLMAELGSHQLDAAGLFLSAHYGEKLRPLAVSGVGGKYYFSDDREVDDHVYVTFEFPQGVVLTYTSICTNAFESYGETLMGTRGTLIVEREKEAMLFKEPDPNVGEAGAREMTVGVTQTQGGAALQAAESPALGSGRAEAAQTAGGDVVSRGYKEELEDFAYCIRNPESGHLPRCNPQVALADAIYALTANEAMLRKQRIEFQDSWFDIDSDDAPELEPVIA